MLLSRSERTLTSVMTAHKSGLLEMRLQMGTELTGLQKPKVDGGLTTGRS